MKKAIFIILNLSLIFNVASMQEDVPSLRVIELQFNDGKKSQEAVDILVQSNTLKNLLEGASGAEIYLENVSSVEGTILIDLLKDLKDNPEEIEQKIIDKVKNLSAQRLVELINAVNFLDIPSLLNPLLKHISSQLNNPKVLKEAIINLQGDMLSLLLPTKIKMEIFDYKISSDGSIIVARVFRTNYIYIFNRVGNLIHSITNREYLAFKISSDGSTIIAIGSDGYIYIYDSSGKFILSITDRKYKQGSPFVMSADGSTFVTIGSDGYIYIYDISGKLIQSIKDREYHSSVISSDGSIIVAVGLLDHFIYIFDRSGTLINSIDDKEYLYSTVISSDGSTIVAEGRQISRFYIFDGSGNPIGSACGHYSGDFLVNSNGSLIVARDFFRPFIYMFDRSGNLISSIKDKKYSQFVISSDGSTIALRGFEDDRNIYIYDRSGGLIRAVTDKEYSHFVMSSDGSIIVAESKDGNTYILRNYNISPEVVQSVIKDIISGNNQDELQELKNKLESLENNFLSILGQEAYNSFIIELNKRIISSATTATQLSHQKRQCPQ